MASPHMIMLCGGTTRTSAPPEVVLELVVVGSELVVGNDSVSTALVIVDVEVALLSDELPDAPAPNKLIDVEAALLSDGLPDTPAPNELIDVSAPLLATIPLNRSP